VHICCLVIPSVVHANSVVMMSSMVSYGKVRPEILVILHSKNYNVKTIESKNMCFFITKNLTGKFVVFNVNFHF
jgi:hypothetical protein